MASGGESADAFFNWSGVSAPGARAGARAALAGDDDFGAARGMTDPSELPPFATPAASAGHVPLAPGAEGGAGPAAFSTEHEPPSSLELFQWREFDYDDIAGEDRLLSDLLDAPVVFPAPSDGEPAGGEGAAPGSAPPRTVFLDSQGRMQVADAGMHAASLLPAPAGFGGAMAHFRPDAGQRALPRAQHAVPAPAASSAPMLAAASLVAVPERPTQALLPDAQGAGERARQGQAAGTSGAAGKRPLGKPGSLNKTRLRWTPELHGRFVDAINFLGGPDSACGRPPRVRPRRRSRAAADGRAAPPRANGQRRRPRRCSS